MFCAFVAAAVAVEQINTLSRTHFIHGVFFMSTMQSGEDFTTPPRPDAMQRSASGSLAGLSTPRFKSSELKELFGTDFQPDPELIKAIESKQCIAFVGAGFTKPITGLDWKSLLISMLNESKGSFKDELHQELMERLKHDRPSAEDYALVAQEIQDILGEERFEEFIQENCKLDPDRTVLNPDMVHRIRCMSRIPFKAILTTNYNSCFSGLNPDVEPALLNGSINPCVLWESILRGSNRDHESNLQDDQDEVHYGAQSPVGEEKPQPGDQDCDDSCPSNLEEVTERMTLRAALDKYKFRCPILKIHGCVEYVK